MSIRMAAVAAAVQRFRTAFGFSLFAYLGQSDDRRGLPQEHSDVTRRSINFACRMEAG